MMILKRIVRILERRSRVVGRRYLRDLEDVCGRGLKMTTSEGLVAFGETQGKREQAYKEIGFLRKMACISVGGFLVLSGCVSRKAYIAQGEALARSLELNKACIASVEALEAKNKAFQGVYGDSLRLRKEAESGKLK